MDILNLIGRYKELFIKDVESKKVDLENVVSKSRFLVLGGAGFIGSNLCEALLEMNNTIVCLDNFTTGKRENLNSCLENPNFTLIEGGYKKARGLFKSNSKS